MTPPLSFRKESIQCSSNAGETLAQMTAGFQAGPGPKAAHEPRFITLTTTLTITQV